MPKTIRLSWQLGIGNREGRWKKVYRGKAYYFPGGKGKSDRDGYDAAWAAWEALKARIDLLSPRKYHRDYEAAIDQWEQVLAWCNRHGEPQLAESAFQTLGVLHKMLAAPILEPLPRSATFEAGFELPHIDLDEVLGNGPSATDMSQMKLAAPIDICAEARARYAAELDGSPQRIAREIWRDRLEIQKRKAASADESLGTYVEKYVKQKEGQAGAGQVSPARIYAIGLHLTHFQDWLGKDTAVREINGEILASYHAHLLTKVTSKEWSRTTASDHLTTVKSFVRWLWQIEAIAALPRVLDGRSQFLKISKPSSKVVIFTKDEIKAILAAASERTKLYILLMLNCGMTQKDVSDLLVSEVDWDEGRIIRKRSKTADEENVPVVNYKLWPDTLRLLRQERATKSKDRVLFNANGGPLWSEEITGEGKYQKTDNVKNAFDRLQQKTNISKPLKSFKKTSATLLRDNGEFSGLAGLFLGHAPQSMADKHYTQTPQGLLDQAIGWLGAQYGLAGKGEPKTTAKAKAKKPSDAPEQATVP